MTSDDLDPASSEAIAARGLVLRRVDAASADFDGWLHAVARGFHDGERSDAQLGAARERNRHRRLTGVLDPSAPEPDLAVGSLSSWDSSLTVPGGEIPARAISAVTVAQTHRRRGIARALLEGELRSAHAAGLPMAMLTVSESTIYGRYGFGAAAFGAILDIDTGRVRWIGPNPTGRLDFVSRAHAREEIVRLHEQQRHAAPGDIALPPGHEGRFSGTDPDADKGGDIRCVQYSDARGEVRGILAYTIAGDDNDFTQATANVVTLVAADDDAYAALWRFALDLDLVATVHAELRAVDEPVLWMIDDRRAASVRVFDHQYLRILDVPAALAARRYGAAGVLAVEVTDGLGIAEGSFLLRTSADGTGVAHALDGDVPADAVHLRTAIAELSAMYLGGVSPVVLARAGRIATSDADACARILGDTLTPRLGFWY